MTVLTLTNHCPSKRLFQSLVSGWLPVKATEVQRLGAEQSIQFKTKSHTLWTQVYFGTSSGETNILGLFLEEHFSHSCASKMLKVNFACLCNHVEHSECTLFGVKYKVMTSLLLSVYIQSSDILLCSTALFNDCICVQKINTC